MLFSVERPENKKESSLIVNESLPLFSILEKITDIYDFLRFHFPYGFKKSL